MRAEFEVYRKEVEVETQTGMKKYNLLPLSGRFYPKLMSVISKLPKNENATEEDFLNALSDESVTGKLHELIFETLKQSLNVTADHELKELDFFVSQNLFKFIPALIDINLGSPKE